MKTHHIEMKLKITSKYRPPMSGGRRHPVTQPRTAREYLECMKPGQAVECTPVEANRFKPAAKRLGVRITQKLVAPGKIRVWKLKPEIDKAATKH